MHQPLLAFAISATSQIGTRFVQWPVPFQFSFTRTFSTRQPMVPWQAHSAPTACGATTPSCLSFAALAAGPIPVPPPLAIGSILADWTARSFPPALRVPPCTPLPHPFKAPFNPQGEQAAKEVPSQCFIPANPGTHTSFSPAFSCARIDQIGQADTPDHLPVQSHLAKFPHATLQHPLTFVATNMSQGFVLP